MRRSMLRVGVVLAAMIFGGTLMATANANDEGGRITSTGADGTRLSCYLINGVWYCFPDSKQAANFPQH